MPRLLVLVTLFIVFCRHFYLLEGGGLGETPVGSADSYIGRDGVSLGGEIVVFFRFYFS